jgi:probable selenium-dependent hydroxylase accessory protein YqeC
MKLYDALSIKFTGKQLVSLVGGGGKTTAMFELAKEMKALGKKILATTTTSIYCPQSEDYDNIFLLQDNRAAFETAEIKPGSVTVIGSKITDEGKLSGLDKEIINLYYKQNIFDIIIVEADGSRQKSIKAPDVHEPVIPEATTKTIGVIGLDSIDKEIIEDNVHRPEIFARVTGSHVMEKINEEIIYKLIINGEGLFKDVPSSSERYLLLNKVEDKRTEEAAVSICNMLLKSSFHLEGIVICSFKNRKIARFGK